MSYNGQSRYMNSIVTGGEIWFYYYGLSIKSQNKTLAFEDEVTSVAS